MFLGHSHPSLSHTVLRALNGWYSSMLDAGWSKEHFHLDPNTRGPPKRGSSKMKAVWFHVNLQRHPGRTPTPRNSQKPSARSRRLRPPPRWSPSPCSSHGATPSPPARQTNPRVGGLSQALRQAVTTWAWVKIKPQGTAGFSPCIHLPGQAILGLPYISPTVT